MIEDPAVLERRTAQRRRVDIAVWVEKLPGRPDCPSLVRARTLDVSHRGAFLLAPPLYSVGQRLRLEMGVAPEEGQMFGLKLRCEAEVVRVQAAHSPETPAGVGIRILKFDTPRPALFPEI